MLHENELMVCSQGMYNNKRSNVSGMDLYYGPENKMPAPCDSCTLSEDFMETGKECSAFRAWCTSGEYLEKNIARLLKQALTMR